MKQAAQLLIAMVLSIALAYHCQGAGQAYSTAGISFEGLPDKPNPPVDPDNPSKPWYAGEDITRGTEHETIVDINPPLDPGGRPQGLTGAAGGLVMDYVTPFYFDTTGAKYDTVLQEFVNIYHRPFLQLSDRRGTEGGWKITATASAIHGFDAVICLQHGSPLSAAIEVIPPVAEQNIMLPLDSRTEQRILYAREKSGALTWVNRWYPVGGSRDVTIRFVPDTRTKRQIEATIIWSLHDAP